MNFTDASKVSATIQATDSVAYAQGNNRAKINNLFNGAPLLSVDDAKKLNLKVNCNFGEAPVLGQHGRRQYHSAFLARSNFFKVTIPDAPPEKQAEWSSFITRKINKPLKKSLTYFELQRSKWAAVLLHGLAPCVYPNKQTIIPEFVALEDFRVPTDTKCDLSNLAWFAVRRAYTEGELSRKAFGPNAAKGWNKKAIAALLEQVHNENWETSGTAKWSKEPEKMAEIVKQNGGFYSGDAVPTIPLFHFYFLDDTKKTKPEWRLRIVADTSTLTAPTNEFMFDNGNECVATEIGQLLQMQVGDLNNKAPFLIHSVRSLGFLLMEPIFHSNLLDCRFLQHVHEHMNAWMRINDPQGKARAQMVNLYDKGIVPDGVTIVPATERHQIQPQLVEMASGRMESLKNQASVSYTQDTQAGRNPDETATAVMARVSQVNAMMSGLLLTARQYEQFACEEICRRFCLKGSQDPMARKFQQECKTFGIPITFMDPELWDVEVEMPLGNGNPTMEMAQSQTLMANRAAFDAQAQQDILHEFVIATTGDPRKAERWVPTDKQRGVTDAQEHAELAFSTLMMGVPVRRREGFSLIDQIETMLGLMAGVIARIEKTGNMATWQEVTGLQNAAQYTNEMIQQLFADEPNKPRAKQYADSLGKLMNAVKGFEQRLVEQQQKAAEAQDQGNAAAIMMDAQAKAQATALQAETKAKIANATAAQKLAHKDRAFEADQQRKDIQTISDQQRKDLTVHGEEQRKNVTTLGDVHRDNVTAKNDIENQKEMAAAKPSKEE